MTNTEMKQILAKIDGEFLWYNGIGIAQDL